MRKKEVPMATQDSPNLYERLGGVYSIATVVDDLIDRVMADPRLNANPLVDDAHHKVPPAGFKYLVTEMLCWADLSDVVLIRCRIGDARDDLGGLRANL